METVYDLGTKMIEALTKEKVTAGDCYVTCTTNENEVLHVTPLILMTQWEPKHDLFNVQKANFKNAKRLFTL
eukprot:3816506-Ditylum_brightwellii.AAC.1